VAALKLGVDALVSRPTRARGLKRTTAEQVAFFAQVAPHAGAWIETL